MKHPQPIYESLEEVMSFDHHGFYFKELTTPAELEQAYALRYKICVVEQKWVKGNPRTKLESDEFDAESYHFGCYHWGDLIGYMRLTRETSAAGTMTRNYFQELISRPLLFPAEHTADLSRLIVDRKYLRDTRRLMQILVGLYRLAYGRSHLMSPMIKYWYFVTTPKLLQGLKWKLLLPVTIIGEGETSDGKHNYVGGIDLAKAKRRLIVLTPWRLHYFHRVTKHAKPR